MTEGGRSMQLTPEQIQDIHLRFSKQRISDLSDQEVLRNTIEDHQIKMEPFLESLNRIRTDSVSRAKPIPS